MPSKYGYMENLTMLKKRIVNLFIGFALALALAGGTGVVADSLGFDVTSEVQAGGCYSGGGC